MKKETWLWLALMGAATLIPTTGCGGDPVEPPTTDGSDVASADATSDADATGPVEDSQPSECDSDDACQGRVSLTGCQEAACQGGTCVAIDGPLCCETVADCDLERFPEVNDSCLELVCEGGICQVEGDPASCCATDADCTDLTTNCCQEGQCIDFECTVVALDECCQLSSDCDDGDPTTSDVCLDACEADGCLHRGPTCEGAAKLLDITFDNATTQGMNVTDTIPADDVSWHLTTDTSITPAYSIHMGHVSCPFYYNGFTEGCLPTSDPPPPGTGMKLRLRSEGVTLDGSSDAYLGFWVRMAAKGGPEADVLRVLIDLAGVKEEVWLSTDALGATNTTHSLWVYQAVNVSTYTGTFKVIFEFESSAGESYLANNGSILEGVYLDTITVTETCPAASCEPGEDLCPTDGDGCTSDACTPYSNSVGGVCAYAVAEQETWWKSCVPCGQPDDCGTNGCYTYACGSNLCETDLKDSCCASYSLFPEGTVPPETTYEGFETGALEDWTITDPTVDNVSWQVDNQGSHEGSYALFFGDPDSGTYAAFDDQGQAQAARATAWSKTFTVTKEQYRTAMLMFWLRLSTQFDTGAEPDMEAPMDTLRLLIRRTDNESVTEVWSSAEMLGNTTQGLYQLIGVNLSSFENKEIRFGFEFDSGEGESGALQNGYGGVRIDNVALNMVCGNAPCSGASECDDGDPCTEDVCQGGSCKNLPQESCCTQSSDCSDANSCTKDLCVNLKCVSSYDEALLDGCCSEGPWIQGPPSDFNTTLSPFTTETDAPPVQWYIDEEFSFEGGGSAHFASPTSGLYHLTGKAPAGRLLSPAVVVPPYPGGVSYVEFMFHMETEWTDSDSFSQLFKYLDELTIRIKKDGVTSSDPVWSSHYAENSTYGDWLMARADLSAYAGDEIQVVFEFNAGDTSNNMYAGAFIDSVRFGTRCKSKEELECVSGDECPKSGSCTFPACDANFECQTPLKNTPQCCEPTVQPAMTYGLNLKKDGYDWDFESCEPGFGDVDASVEWQIAKNNDSEGIPIHEGTGFLYFGNGNDFGGTGLGSCGTALSTERNLDPDLPWTLHFWAYVDVEKSPACEGGGATWVDDLEIFVVDVATGIDTKVWTKSDVACDAYAAWMPYEVDLSNFDGKTVQLRFDFNSWDQAKNTGSGVGFDTIEFERGCAQP